MIYESQSFLLKTHEISSGVLWVFLPLFLGVKTLHTFFNEESLEAFFRIIKGIFMTILSLLIMKTFFPMALEEITPYLSIEQAELRSEGIFSFLKSSVNYILSVFALGIHFFLLIFIFLGLLVIGALAPLAYCLSHVLNIKGPWGLVQNFILGIGTWFFISSVLRGVGSQEELGGKYFILSMATSLASLCLLIIAVKMQVIQNGFKEAFFNTGGGGQNLKYGGYSGYRKNPHLNLRRKMNHEGENRSHSYNEGINTEESSYKKRRYLRKKESLGEDLNLKNKEGQRGVRDSKDLSLKEEDFHESQKYSLKNKDSKNLKVHQQTQPKNITDEALKKHIDQNSFKSAIKAEASLKYPKSYKVSKRNKQEELKDQIQTLRQKGFTDPLEAKTYFKSKDFHKEIKKNEARKDRKIAQAIEKGEVKDVLEYETKKRYPKSYSKMKLKEKRDDEKRT